MALAEVCICLYVVFCGWQCVKKCDGWIKERASGCIRGGGVPLSCKLPNIELGNASKGASSGFGRGVHSFICYCLW